MLVQHFAARLSVDRVPIKRFTPEALLRLEGMEWPGNVRELRNTVERLLILTPGDTIRSEDVDLLVGGPAGGSGLSGEMLAAETFGQFKEAAERAFILQKLRENDWNVSETARRIEMPRSNLYKKIERYALLRDG